MLKNSSSYDDLKEAYLKANKWYELTNKEVKNGAKTPVLIPEYIN